VQWQWQAERVHKQANFRAANGVHCSEMVCSDSGRHRQSVCNSKLHGELCVQKWLPVFFYAGTPWCAAEWLRDGVDVHILDVCVYCFTKYSSSLTEIELVEISKFVTW
jgi:hypothetical protein